MSMHSVVLLYFSLWYLVQLMYDSTPHTDVWDLWGKIRYVYLTIFC